jgi:hypothetical protein
MAMSPKRSNPQPTLLSRSRHPPGPTATKPSPQTTTSGWTTRPTWLPTSSRTCSRPWTSRPRSNRCTRTARCTWTSGLRRAKRHGAALDALQEIARTVVHHRTGERCQVVVDVEDYRKRRRAQIVSRALQTARRVQKTGRPERLDAMNAFERKIVHDAVSEISGVATASEGEDPERRVVIRRA